MAKSDGAFSALRRSLGPGLLMAGAAVGVSHLVQATRAGAEYGFLLLGLVLLTCALKYPFLEYGPRYATATGESLLHGYQRLGRWAIGLYTLITVGTMFAILASVTLVTAGLAARLLGPDLMPAQWSFMVLAACALILLPGQFRALDLVMKVIMLLLVLLTGAAVMLALVSPETWQNRPPSPSFFTLWSGAQIAFLLALMGWMPIPLDVAAWHSLWSLERCRESGHKPSMRHALIDFNIGYLGASVLAACFLFLGAVVMYGSGESFSGNAVTFSSQFAGLYGSMLGAASEPFILVSAFVVMFSTTLAVSDAYPRVLGVLIGFVKSESSSGNRWTYATLFVIVAFGALSLIHLFGTQMTVLVDFATTISFLSAPILAWLNYRLVTGSLMPEAYRPGRALRLLSWTGMVFLGGFSLVWAGWRLTAAFD